MYVLSWNDDNSSKECVAATAESAWEIYWVLKKYYETIQPTNVCRLKMYFKGTLIDPTQGNVMLPAKEGFDGIILNPGRHD